MINSSKWKQFKTAFIALFNSDSQEEDSTSANGATDSDSTGFNQSNQEKNQGVIDPKAATYVKDPETVLYNELKKDPAAMLALKRLTNGQIPSSELIEEFEEVRNSEVALQTIVNSPYASSDVKARAREELASKQRRKLQAQPGFKNNPQTPRLG